MAHFKSVKEKIAKAYDVMKADFGYKNKMRSIENIPDKRRKERKLITGSLTLLVRILCSLN
jgi:hypothetical protein